MYNIVVLVCTVNVYIPLAWADGQSSGTRCYRYVKNCTHFTYSVRTDSYVRCREYYKQFKINTARHLLSAIFIARHLKCKKHNLTYSVRLYFYPLYLWCFLIYFVSCQTNRSDQTSPKVPVVLDT